MPIVHSTYFIFVFKAKFNPADANTSFYDIYLVVQHRIFMYRCTEFREKKYI